MGIIDALFGKDKRPADDSVEFPADEEMKEKMSVRIENVGGLADVERIASYIRQGNVVLIKVKDLEKRDVGLFQTAMQKMKRMSTQFNWDMVALNEGYVIVTPSFVRIERPS